MTIGENIKKMRLKAGLTQQQLANKIGVESKSFISALERGVGKPGDDTMPRLVKALDTTEEVLRFGEPTKEDEFLEEVISEARRQYQELAAEGSLKGKAGAMTAILEKLAELGQK